MAYLDSYLFDNDVNNINHWYKFITRIKPYEYNNIENKENKELETVVVGWYIINN